MTENKALTVIEDDVAELGPAMQALTPRQRKFVLAYFDHPNYSREALAAEAGFSNGPKGNSLQPWGSRLMRSEPIIAAINEEASKRMRHSGALGVQGVIALALNPQHKDHLKACIALMDRTGFHAMSEHKVTVDDKRPQTKKEMIDRVKLLAEELGLGPEAVKKMTGEDVVDAEYQVVESVEASIEQQMEDL